METLRLIIIAFVLFIHTLQSRASLSISVETSIHTATVYFVYDEPKNITHFEANIKYLDSGKQYEHGGCSVDVTISPWICSIQKILEATDFNVIARACNKEVCERPVVVQERTKLRAPLDVQVTAVSPYVLNFTIIPPPHAVASYYEMNFKDGFYATRCGVSARRPPFICVYEDLQPETTYHFEYYGGKIAWGLDIYSVTKYKTVSTPPIHQTTLSLSVTTTMTTANVTFLYDDLENVRIFVAYVNRHGSSQKCSVSPNTSPLQCTLTGIREATEFTVVAEVCLREKPACEPEVMQKTRTQLRAPEDLVIEAESSTELSLTFVPTKNPRASFYVGNYKHGNNDTRCLLLASERPLICKYINLKPSTWYTFEYFAGAYASGSDIWSIKRYKTALTPANPLKITIKTSTEAVEVTFHYKDSKNVRQYEAYVDNRYKCSRPGSEAPYRCLIKGLEEAKEYVIYARVCLSGKAHCEPEIKEKARTGLRAPLGLDIVPVSSTTLNLTVLPTKNSAADYYVMNFKGGKTSTECTVYASDRSYSCIYGRLKPHTTYTFEYYAGANAPKHDILSEIRYASGSTLPEPLAISVTTTVVAAEVNFIYMDTANVRQYEAYVGSLTSSQRCSRPGDAPPYKCQIRGLREATEYIILARVCLLGKSTCEPPIEKTARTELRAPTASLTTLSSREMRLTFQPPRNPQADYYEANFINGGNSTLCTVAASASPLACTFGHLKPDSFYKFDYYAGATAPGHDIWSDIRQISERESFPGET